MLKPSDVSCESLDITDGHRSLNDLETSDQTDGHIADVLQESGQRMHESGIELRLVRRIEKLVVELIKTLDGLILIVIRLDQEVSRIHLLDMTVDLTEIF